MNRPITQLNKKSGFSMIEALVSISIASVMVVVIGSLMGTMRNAYQSSEIRQQAQAYLQEEMESILSRRDEVILKTPGPYHFDGSGNLVAGEYPSLPAGFTGKNIDIENLNRNPDGSLGGATPDPKSKKITISLVWEEKGIERSISASQIMNDWESP